MKGKEKKVKWNCLCKGMKRKTDTEDKILYNKKKIIIKRETDGKYYEIGCFFFMAFVWLVKVTSSLKPQSNGHTSPEQEFVKFVFLLLISLKT